MAQTRDQLAYLGFQLFPPAPALSPFVRSYWYFRREAPLLTLHEEYMHPSGGYGIVFNFGDRLSLDGSTLADPVFLDGTNTISRRMGFVGCIEVMGVRFYAGGAYPFLNVPLAELRNEIALLDALDRPALLRLHTRLCEAKSLPARIHLLEHWLMDCLLHGKERHAVIPASLAALRAVQGCRAIPDLAQQLAISQRQLERLFHSQVGMSPRQYAQLCRIETARLALKQMTSQSNTSLAADLGFYDQSHFIREFRSVVGMTPHGYMKRSRTRSSPGN